MTEVAEQRERIAFDEADSARVRERQIVAVERFMPATMTLNLFLAAGVFALFHEVGGSVLMIWFGTVAALSFARIGVSAGRRRDVIAIAKRPSMRPRYMVEAAVAAGINAAGPAWLLASTPGSLYALLICHLTGIMWAGSLLLTPLFAVDVVYVAASFAVVSAGVLCAGAPMLEHGLIVAMFAAGAVTMLLNAHAQSRLFARSELRKIGLGKQNELIGILLKDFEEQASDWLWTLDAEHRFRAPSSRFCEALGVAREAIEGHHLAELLARSSIVGNTTAVAALLATMRSQATFRDMLVPVGVGGVVRWWSFSGRATRSADGRGNGYRGVVTDVTAELEAKARISHLAHHDGLTDLPNRRSFGNSLRHALERDAGRPVAVISLDLDGFKAVNDRWGHPVGDDLLVQLAARLRAVVHDGDVLSRFGGDEFMILCHEAGNAAVVSLLCDELVAVAAAPFDVGGVAVALGTSVGVAVYPDHGLLPDELVRNADAALYRAKTAGRGTHRFYEAGMDQLVRDRAQLRQDLRSALARGELEVHFQPYVAADTELVTGAEALARWVHPLRGTVSPADFIPLAEENGVIWQIGEWVLRQACFAASRWPPDQRVSVNISPVQFRTPGLPLVIAAALGAAGLAPHRLEIEVTETVFIDDAEAALVALRQIRALGVKVALDDFGTGYSSLSYLRSFPFDKVKIDRAFVHELDTSRDSQIIVQAIRDLAKGLGMTITAEGVETPEQARCLREAGCEELQGYLYGRPAAECGRCPGHGPRELDGDLRRASAS